MMLDLYKRRIQPDKKFGLNPIYYFLYLLMFPKVIAGPISRYGEISTQLELPKVEIVNVVKGIERFIIGLAKKTIIADQLAPLVDAVFALSSSELTSHYAWLGVIGFSLQLYFDFSGYTDMAIGIGLMLGINLPENFNFPYLATSIANFWRRWHISLSNWFRDYLFYPLERFRRGKSHLWQYGNVLIVFIATGLWHGLTINFFIWGLLHGIAIAFEISPVGGWLRNSWIGIQRFYTLAIILLGWVFFRSATLTEALAFIKALIGLSSATKPIPFERLPIMSGLTWIALIVGLILCLPIHEWLTDWFRKIKPTYDLPYELINQFASKITLIGILIASIFLILGSSFQAALYARF